MEEKIKKLLNDFSSSEMREFWRFLRTKKWIEWINTRMNGRKIE